jgi:hypothetical protein
LEARVRLVGRQHCLDQAQDNETKDETTTRQCDLCGSDRASGADHRRKRDQKSQRQHGDGDSANQ